LDRFLNEQKREDECDVRKETNIIRWMV
jgi:hypothetical protein